MRDDRQRLSRKVLVTMYLDPAISTTNVW